MKRLVNKSVAVLATAAFASLGAVAIAPAASADTPGCVTRAEYRSVQYGMSKPRVHNTFDTSGAFYRNTASGFSRIYSVCNLYSKRHSVVVKYMDMGSQPAMVESLAWRPLGG